ncbi:MAG: flagellar hook-basal body complex protein, partial [Alphaproteobacteria bacterium]|nr:flagellar hook-basal body complex protein [Alphaproteobacteria bacterium]
MSILGALQAGVSGLSAQSSAMGAVADNIANMNTVGYKNNNVTFSTLVTKQVSSSKYSPGGVQSHSSQSIDAQGLLSAVSSNTSLAVSGAGFFVVNSNSIGDGTWAYTRAGDFLKDETGYLVNSGGYYAQAWSLMPWDGTTSASTVEINGIIYMKAYKNDAGETVYINDNIVDQNNLRGINLSNIGGTATPTTQIAFGANLPSGTAIGDTHSISTLIYDSLGNPNNVSLDYTKQSANSWRMEATIPSGAAAVNLYSDKGLVYGSTAQMEFSDI